jgi:hypothetical protein
MEEFPPLGPQWSHGHWKLFSLANHGTVPGPGAAGVQTPATHRNQGRYLHARAPNPPNALVSRGSAVPAVHESEATLATPCSQQAYTLPYSADRYAVVAAAAALHLHPHPPACLSVCLSACLCDSFPS